MNILIVKLSALGDVIHALPVASALKHRFPKAHLTWVVEPPAYDLVKHNPLVDEIIIFDKKQFKSWSGFCRAYPKFKRELRQRKFDLSIDLQGLFKSAAVAYTAGAKKKIGYCDMREGANLISKVVRGKHSQGHIVDRYLDTLDILPGDNGKIEFPWQVEEAEEIKVKELLAQNNIGANTPYCLFAVGTNWDNKCWNPKAFAKLGDLLQAQRIQVILIGYGPKDEMRSKEIMASGTGKPINLVGCTTLGETACLIKGAKAVIGGDTGNLHLAAALNIPAIMLMGPTNPERNGPYEQRENVLLVNRSCAGCWQRKCPKGLDCLSVITPEMVLAKVKELR